MGTLTARMLSGLRDIFILGKRTVSMRGGEVRVRWEASGPGQRGKEEGRT